MVSGNLNLFHLKERRDKEKIEGAGKNQKKKNDGPKKSVLYYRFSFFNPVGFFIHSHIRLESFLETATGFPHFFKKID